jgi:hypothetical protein
VAAQRTTQEPLATGAAALPSHSHTKLEKTIQKPTASTQEN